MPCNTGDGAANWLLQVLGHPPIVLLLEVADGNDTVTRANGELGLGWRPTDEGSGAIDSEKDEGGFVALWRRLPYQRIPVYTSVSLVLFLVFRSAVIHTLRGGHNATRIWCNVDTGDGLIMSLQLVLQLERIASRSIELDGRVSRDGQS